jgi:hypothetical protein
MRADGIGCGGLLRYRLNIADVGTRFIAPVAVFITKDAINRVPTNYGNREDGNI